VDGLEGAGLRLRHPHTRQLRGAGSGTCATVLLSLLLRRLRLLLRRLCGPAQQLLRQQEAQRCATQLLTVQQAAGGQHVQLRALRCIGPGRGWDGFGVWRGRCPALAAPWMACPGQRLPLPPCLPSLTLTPPTCILAVSSSCMGLAVSTRPRGWRTTSSSEPAGGVGGGVAGRMSTGGVQRAHRVVARGGNMARHVQLVELHAASNRARSTGAPPPLDIATQAGPSRLSLASRRCWRRCSARVPAAKAASPGSSNATTTCTAARGGEGPRARGGGGGAAAGQPAGRGGRLAAPGPCCCPLTACW